MSLIEDRLTTLVGIIYLCLIIINKDEMISKPREHESSCSTHFVNKNKKWNDVILFLLLENAIYCRTIKLKNC